MRFISIKHPELRLHLGDDSVKFRAGVAEVTDPDLISQLHRYEHLGIEPDDEDEHEQDDENPQGDDVAEDHESEDENGPEGGDPESDAPVDRSDWSEEQLRAFATEHGIDLGKLQNLDKIRTRITEALAAE